MEWNKFKLSTLKMFLFSLLYSRFQKSSIVIQDCQPKTAEFDFYNCKLFLFKYYDYIVRLEDGI